MFKRTSNIGKTSAGLLIASILGAIGNAFGVKATGHRPSRHKGGRRPGRVSAKKGLLYTPGVPGAKLAKKAAKGTVGLRNGAPFGQR